MPKPGKYNNPPWKKQFNNEHDSRGNEFNNHRRGTGLHTNGHFKPAKKNWNPHWGNALRAHLDDEDIDMGVSNFERQKKPIRGNKRHGTSGGRGRRKLLESPTNWFRVTLPYGNKYDKAFVLRSLLEHVTPIPFAPVAWSTDGNFATFYVDDYKLADKLNSLDRQIDCPDGFKLAIRVHSGSPNVDITDSLKAKLKAAMANRYDLANKALDLTKFHADPQLQDVFCALFKPIMLLTVIDIMSENIPELVALNLNENRIQVLNHLKKIDKKLPNLKILHLGNNKIREMTMLDPLSGLPIVEVVLDGNPLCTKFREREAYISEVRKRFPKVIKLDGIDLPPPIGFDIAEEVRLPPSVQTYLCNAEAQGIVRQFLEQYFQVFDSGSRQPLLQAYHEDAKFSMTSAYPYGQNPKNSSWLNWYNTDSRNILRVQDHDRRLKLLKQGNLAVVSFLSEMPQSKHDIHSFTVDLNISTPQLLLLNVSGMFRELRSGHKTAPIRHFFRSLVIVPAGSGFCIANEQLHVSNATEQQAKLAFKTPIIQTPQPAPELNAAPPAAAIPPVVPMVDDNTKQQMIQTMSQQSGMNLEWSQKCSTRSNLESILLNGML
ncbi:nuclear RNA export factor 1 isoform X2 [Photinus pyralis]|uniref:nuclear RNA export factor 1 isoform X2 n=1 Tax=Photinus pyralis TaxID=7054 RepID=UPI001266FCA2|nr:nuclear RNA export factor 1 isoform X2 [Photinus pyralis]